MRKANVDDAIIINIFLLMCLMIGVMIGLAGLGLGLVFLSIPQAIGVGMLATGLGALAAFPMSAPILRAIMKAIDEMNAKGDK